MGILEKIVIVVIASVIAVAFDDLHSPKIEEDVNDEMKGNKVMDKKNILEYVGHCSRNVTEHRDKETGVHYLIFAESNGAGGGYGGLCPRYNADGSLYVD